MINLSHISKKVKKFVADKCEQDITQVLNTELHKCKQNHHLVASDDISNPPVRIRPNSTFLKRYVGSVERSNERVQINSSLTAENFDSG
jgi:hypothetical protein